MQAFFQRDLHTTSIQTIFGGVCVLSPRKQATTMQVHLETGLQATPLGVLHNSHATPWWRKISTQPPFVTIGQSPYEFLEPLIKLLLIISYDVNKINETAF